MVVLLAWDVGVTVAFKLGWIEFRGITIQYTLYGTAIALFLGLMVNASYARWWEARTLWGSIVNHSRNLGRQATTLSHIAVLLREAYRREMVSDIARVQVESTLSILTDAQGGIERIKKTPLPVQYRFLPSFFAHAFCVILPFAVYEDLQWWTPVGSGLIGMMFLLAVQVGRDLADPFLDGVHDVPMTAICRSIEIDLLEMIGAETPEAVAPVEEVLW